MTLLRLLSCIILAASLACGGGGGSNNPGPAAPTISSFSAGQTLLTAGSATTLTAGGTGTLDQGLGAVTTGVPVPTGILLANTTFTLTVTNAAGTSVTLQVLVQAVPAPTISSFTNSSPILSGTSATLTAVFTNGTAILQPGAVSLSSGVGYGTAPLTAPTTYTLTVTNAAGTSVSATTTVSELAATASLTLTCSGLPAGMSALVKVFGPYGYQTTATGTANLPGLLAGAYTVVPSGLWGTGAASGQVYQASGAQVITLAEGGSAGATISYAPVPSLTIQVPLAATPATSVPLELVTIPAGTFSMGAYPGEQGSSVVELPQHQVTISQSFYLAKVLTTQAQWQAVTGNNPSVFSLAGGGSSSDDLTRPVEYVSWNDLTTASTGFLDRLNAATAATRPAGTSFRLPTESEWEYASRAGTSTRFFWGDDPSYLTLNLYAYDFGDSGGSTQPVANLGAGSANPLGLFDLPGDVWEWCSDWYGPYAAGAQTDPLGAAAGTFRVVRGGSWYNGPAFCRSANRSNSGPDDRFSSIGFRVVLAKP